MKLNQSSISFVHCFLSICVGFIIFTISNRCKKPEKIPITIFSKIFYFTLNLQLLKLMTTPFNKRGSRENGKKDFETKKEEIKQEMEEQEKTDW